MADFFDIYPQKFYLFSVRNCRFLDMSSSDHRLDQAVEKAFSQIKCLEGGNIYAIYEYEEKTLSILQALSDKYKEQYPKVQQLPAFFKTFKKGEKFIRQNSAVSLFDLKSSIVKVLALSKDLDIHKAHEAFVQNWARLYLSFHTYSFGFLPDKIYIGEVDKTKRKCRFCDNAGAKYFKNVSHAVQESLGNHLLIANEECDECNSLFSNSVEKQLFRFLETNRTLSQVKGKGKSTYHQEGLNFHIHPDAVSGLPTIYVKQEHIYNVAYQGKPTGFILLYNKGSITYQGIYKALIKIAVDMIPQKYIHHFTKTGKWVHGDFEADNLAPFFYGEHTFFFEQPIIDIFFRNEKSPKYSPYCTVILYIYESVFIYTIPFNDVDGKQYMTAAEVQSHFKFFKDNQYLYVKDWVEYDSNDTTEYAAHYKVSCIGVPDKYNIEYRPSNDPIFINRKD